MNFTAPPRQIFFYNFSEIKMTTSYFDTCKLARAELRATEAAFIVFEHGGRWYELASIQSKPKLICGARKKTGERCRSKKLYRGGRCKFHGGLSTGARTPEGKARAIAAMRAGLSQLRARVGAL
jgi:hypothetical protein